MNKNFIFIILTSAFSLAFDWSFFSIQRETPSPIKIQTVWTVDTVKNKTLRAQLTNNSPPLITEKVVVQGNSINGIKAYNKDKGRKLWEFYIQSGVASPVVLHKNNLYFGGADGFFYSLKLKTGELNWKFWTGSENSSSALIHNDRVYWTANNQKLYALTLQGKLLWIYSGPSLPKDFVVRGRPRPLVYKNWIYTGFYDGSLFALNKNTGRLKWKRSLSSSQAIREDMELSGNCLFVPVFDFHLFCLKALNGKIRWKAEGGSSVNLSSRSVIYHSHKNQLKALKKFKGKTIWKKETKSRILPPLVFKNYLIYGSSSEGKLIFANAKNGKTLKEYKFGKGLAAPVRGDLKNNSIYFSSVDGYLHKLSVL